MRRLLRLGVKGEPVAIGKLERFVGDWKIENADKMPAPDIKRNGHKVAVIGSVLRDWPARATWPAWGMK